jgi:ribose 5-phosphate isomerase B
MRIAFGCDHAGYALKQTVVGELEKLGHTVMDCGALALERGDDYPDYAQSVGAAIQQGKAERGIAICGSGIGMSIAANKLRGVRAGVCHDTYSARQGVEHDDMNVLCLGAFVIGDALAKELVRAYAAARYAGAPQFQRRLNKITKMEETEARNG